jgi:hypothetical protein
LIDHLDLPTVSFHRDRRPFVGSSTDHAIHNELCLSGPDSSGQSDVPHVIAIGMSQYRADGDSFVRSERDSERADAG